MIGPEDYVFSRLTFQMVHTCVSVFTWHFCVSRDFHMILWSQIWCSIITKLKKRGNTCNKKIKDVVITDRPISQHQTMLSARCSDRKGPFTLTDFVTLTATLICGIFDLFDGYCDGQNACQRNAIRSGIAQCEQALKQRFHSVVCC